MATVAVDLAPPLPAPQNLGYRSYVDYVLVFWDEVAGAGADSPSILDPESRDGYWTTRGTLRTRLVTDEAWTYQELEGRLGVILDPLPGLRILQTAVVRHPLELETPEALSWSEELTYAATTQAQNVRIEATHDTVTVSWDRQPHAQGQAIRVWLSDGTTGRALRSWEEPGLTGRHEVTYTHVPPDRDYRLTILMVDTESRTAPPEHALRTLPAPPGWTAPPRGAQNLRAAFSADQLTVTWDLPYPDAPPTFWLTIENAETGRDLYKRFAHDITNWEIPLTRLSRSASRYRIIVSHNDLPPAVAEIMIQRPAASGTAAQMVEPLTLELTSSRELCTANTLTELSWTISGGRPPYTLNIDGETVAANAESHRANCGPIPADPFTNDPLPNPTKSFSATVTDSQTTPDSATGDVRVELVPPLPAPQNVQYASYVADVPVRWDPVPGAGAQSPRSIHPDSGTDWQITGVVRTRLLDDRVWSYDVAGFAQGRKTLAPLAGLRVLSVAAVRHPLEVDTPEALNWSAELTYAVTTEAQNVVLTVTHDTLTASWDKQPYARDQGIHAILELEATGGERRLQLWEEEGVSGRHEVTIGDLPPETDFTFAIVMVDTSATSGNPFRRAVRTKPAPPGWIPLPTGAQNLRVTSSDDGHTISWDPPSPHSARSWALRVDNVATGRNVFHTFTSGATTWTISRDRLFSSARYRVTVVHFDLERTETSIEFNTTQSPPVGQRGARSAGEWTEQQLLALFSAWPHIWWRSALITTDPATWPHWISALLSLQTRLRENH